MNFSLWLSDKDICRCLEIEGYTLISVCNLLKQFGYKTGKEARKELCVKDSFLRCKLAYKNEKELNIIYDRLSLIVKYLKEEKNTWIRDAQLLCLGLNDKNEYTFNFSAKTCYVFKAQRKFDAILRKRIKNKYDLNIWTRDDE